MPMNCATCRHFETTWAQWWAGEAPCCDCCIRTPLFGDGVHWQPREGLPVVDVRDARSFRGDSFEGAP